MNTEYLSKVRALLDFVENTQLTSIEQVASVCADALEQGHMLYFFGTGHSHMIAEEPFYRAGGLAAVSPILKNFLMLHEGAAVSSTYERLTGLPIWRKGMFSSSSPILEEMVPGSMPPFGRRKRGPRPWP